MSTPQLPAVALLPMFLIAIAFAQMGCDDASPPSDPSTDSETHWLVGCLVDDDCPDGSTCQCKVCSASCDPSDVCSLAGFAGACVAPEAVSGAECDPSAMSSPEGLCTLECTTDADCEDNEPPLSCQEGACLPTAGDDGSCSSNGDCDAEEYCARTTCTGSGTCEGRPQGCDMLYDPVCGCDGVTYGNACAAAGAGVNVESTGECDDTGDCGGFAGLTCEPNQYCFYPEGSCGIADELGVCLPRPEACTFILDPVCACDGVEYDNECFAQMAGVDAAGEGPCTSTCALPSDCPTTAFCNFDSVGACLIFDVFGVCRPRPESCGPETAEVCGCDGTTYDNECQANLAGMDLQAEAACN